MNYLRDKGYNFSQKNQLGWKKPASMALAILVLYLWGSSFLVDVSSFVIYPYLKMSGRIEQNFSDAFSFRRNILEENKKLKTENAVLKAESLRISNLQLENNKLRGLESSNSADLFSARVISKPNHLPYDEIIIDVGSDQVPAFRVGQLVFADKDVVLGQIESVASQYSKIKLYSTGGVKIPVVVGELAVPSIAEGLGAGNFSLTLPRGVTIKVGDQVKTSIVGDYILGYVAGVLKDSNDPFQKVIFRSPYNFFELERVMFRR